MRSYFKSAVRMAINNRRLLIAVVGLAIALSTGLYLRSKTVNDGQIYAPATNQQSTTSNGTNGSPVLVPFVEVMGSTTTNQSTDGRAISSTPTQSPSQTTPTPFQTIPTQPIPTQPTPTEQQDSYDESDLAYYYCVAQRDAALEPIQVRLDENRDLQSTAESRMIARTSGYLVTEAQLQKLIVAEKQKLWEEETNIIAEYNEVYYQYNC